MSKNDYSRRDFIKALGLSAAVLSLPSNLVFGKYVDPTRRPNILFIMSDDHALQAVGAYGSVINKTPNIDRIAATGMKLNNCFCTNSICAPSRASILTGKYSHLNGQYDNRNIFDGSQATFPKLLQANSYQTSLIGKWHLKSNPTGFDYWNIVPDQGQYYNPDFIEMGENKIIEGYSTDITTDLGLNWLNQRDKSKPFCLLLQHKAPHRNFMPPLKYINKYDDVEIPMPENFFDDYETRSAAAKEQAMEIAKPEDMYWGFDLKLDAELDADENARNFWIDTLSRFTNEQRKAWDAAYAEKNQAFKDAKPKGEELAKWRYQRFIKDYIGCVDSLDENIGRVLDYLEANDLAENTIVVYTSDQGFFLGEHGWFDKRFMYEESLHMPFLIRYPEKIKPGTSSNEFILNIDFASTLLDYTCVKIPVEMQGESFRKILEDKKTDNWRDAIYYHYYEYPAWHMVKKHYGIRTKRYKLIHFYDDIDAWELYDLRNDPNEMNNLFGNEAYSTVVNDLKDQMKQLQIKYGDTEFIDR